jgi:putative ABC transport system permease protein
MYAAPLILSAALAAGSAPADVLVSHPLLAKEHLHVGDVVRLSGDPQGRAAREFRIAGAYDPLADPKRLGEERLETRMHLDDLLALRAAGSTDAADPFAVDAVNVALHDPKASPAFAHDLAARMPGLLIRTTTPTAREAAPFVVLDRFHFAIAIVTVLASSLFLLALMVMLVDERRDTVAVLRLIGLGRRRILLQVLAEGVLVAATGAASGIVLAIVLQHAFNRFFQWRYDTPLVFVRVTAAVAAHSVLIAIPLGVLATLGSSWGLLRRGVLALARR